MKRYLAVLVFIFVTVKAGAANHFVRQGATGSANGIDWVNAYPSLPATLIRGDTYFIAAGNYPGRSFDTPTSGTTQITIKKAIESDHGTETGWQSSYGTSQVVFSSGISFSTAYWLLDGQTGGGPGSWTSGFGFRVNHTSSPAVEVTSGGDNITLRHIELQGNLTDGVSGFRLSGADNFTVSYWYTENIGNCPFSLIPVSGFLAEYGYVGKYYGSAASHSEIASIWGGVTGTTTFRYNIFANVTSTGGLMWDNHEDHTAQLQIYGNVFYKSPTSVWDNDANGLIGGWTGGNGEDLYNLRVYNNTFYNTTGRIFTTFAVRSGNNEVKNNLFYNSDSPGFDDIQIHDYNHYINSGGLHAEANGSTSIENPVVNASDLDFRLTTSTVTGVFLPAPYNLDPLGSMRGSSGTWDRGAYEFVSGQTVPPVMLAPPSNLRVISLSP
ncbi:MAG: hypothetical protein ACXWRA_10060 [Pseudobdellovibrionaceae bacterium]